jgi:hypothetical protein
MDVSVVFFVQTHLGSGEVLAGSVLVKLIQFVFGQLLSILVMSFWRITADISNANRSDW